MDLYTPYNFSPTFSSDAMGSAFRRIEILMVCDAGNTHILSSHLSRIRQALSMAFSADA